MVVQKVFIKIFIKIHFLIIKICFLIISFEVMPCCFRTYCLTCLEKLQQNQQVKCPGCSNEVHLNDNGVSGLHTDYSIIRILEQINEINNGLTNGNLNGTNNNLKELTCSMHNDELLRYYCKTCDQATCKECISFQHQKHDNEYLIDASNKFVSFNLIFRVKKHFFKSFFLRLLFLSRSINYIAC